MNNNHIIFSRDLNLLIYNDITTFLQEIEGVSHRMPVNTETELRQLIKFGRSFFPDSAFTIVGGGFTPIHITPKNAINFSFLGVILPLVSFLHKFQTDTDFINKIKVNISNLKQFSDTIFELKCLKQFSENGFDFYYEPSITVGAKEKKPDFILTKDNVELFVECKQIRMGQGKAEIKFTEYCNYLTDNFPKGLNEQLYAEKLRLEVNFKQSPSKKDLNALVKQMRDLFNNSLKLHELHTQQIGDTIEYTIVGQGEPSQFPMKSIMIGTVLVGTEPRRVLNPVTDSPAGETLFYSNDLDRRRRTTLVRSIREAKNQLPYNELGIIILGKTKLRIAMKEIENRMHRNQYSNVIAFVVNPFEDFWSCYRTNLKELMAQLFDGFQIQNPFH